MKTESTHKPQPEIIRRMFSEIAGRYDLANTVLSAGIHHLWRRKLVKWSGARSGMSVLDCATGTGDLAIEFARVVGETGAVTGTDFCADMMMTAPAKAARNGLAIKFETADAMNLPYADASFDFTSISFGIRNVADPAKALTELARVTKPGGVVMVLEFGQPQTPGIAQAYDLYSRRVLPKIGGLLTGNSKAYEYLQNSSSAFPCRDEFTTLMNSTGRYRKIEWRPLSMGIAYMYRGVVK